MRTCVHSELLQGKAQHHNKLIIYLAQAWGG